MRRGERERERQRGEEEASSTNCRAEEECQRNEPANGRRGSRAGDGGKKQKGIHSSSDTAKKVLQQPPSSPPLISCLSSPPSFLCSHIRNLNHHLEARGREGRGAERENGVSKHSRQLSIQGTQRKEGRATVAVGHCLVFFPLCPQLIAVVRYLVSLWRHFDPDSRQTRTGVIRRRIFVLSGEIEAGPVF